ncbi:MAG: gamma-glutamyltransferase [Candidatus Thorarchaeota archaeon]
MMVFWRRPTGRSEVIADRGIVASSQPLATQVGLKMLQQGGNAVDAAVATAATLDVVEPFSTGCGGDAFALLHVPGESEPLAFNGSGRAGSLVTLDELREREWDRIPVRGGAPVTVPGAMHLWHFMISNYGALDFGTVVSPAIYYAENGFPVSPVIAEVWDLLLSALRNETAETIFTIDGRAPKPGERMVNPRLARTFREVAENGISSFYSGAIAESIVETVQEHGGFLKAEDLADHTTEQTSPISTSYRGVDIYEHGPNGQGFAALEMLNMMEEFELSELDHLSAGRYHIMIEAKKMAYADLYQHNADPDFYDVPLGQLLSKQNARKRSKLINPDKAMDVPESGIDVGTDTVYLAAADKDGRAISFINSLYMGFGSGLVVPEWGIKLQNRGRLFSLDHDHPNCYEPGKRPFHTIIPGAAYSNGDLLGVFGIMGGPHQAQAHAQFVSNMLDYELSPQEALDHPRFHHNQNSNTVALENGIPPQAQGELRKRGHSIAHETMAGFGGGQAIFRLRDAWIAGSDFRKDGQATGF